MNSKGYRFSCGFPVKVGDILGDLTVDRIEGTSESFSVTYTTPGRRVTVTVVDVQQYTRKYFIEKIQADVAGARGIEQQFQERARKARITIDFPTGWSEEQQLDLVRKVAEMVAQFGCGVAV
jgi:hypothetical protein